MPVTSKQEILTLLAAHEAPIRRYGVTRYGLFGSFVRNEAHAESDIDVLVEFDPAQKTFDNFIQLAWYLEDLFGRPVDLITADSLSPYLGPRILQEVEYVSRRT
ncbi:nucleotidyltransferase family protein [Candidatus Chloroploca sp. M-50]|uniref:Nucleotidyltransferase n=2 Tax=Candidatus Chloroploca TaxID=1579476 RepID=A0A2H3L0W2_9CHLR|nr:MULTISPECIES: nucleotidyltransferase family protein [Candidatus Chloroploca]MBP1465750.1 nucleotidyltransferase family protein [Candidatus Chloroploca mongolica]PDV99966.1 nucleotidyltransferase [Candidatus Chloroploca asiatica]